MIAMVVSAPISEPRAPARALEPQTLEQLSSWLQLEDARGELSTRNELMPSVFKDQRNTDYLCPNCSSIPWRDISAAMSGEQPLSGPETVVYDLPTLQEIVASALAGCHFCVLILLATFSRHMGGLEVPRWAEDDQKRKQYGSAFGYRKTLNTGSLALPHAALTSADLSKTCQMYLSKSEDAYHRSDYWSLEFFMEGNDNHTCLQLTQANDPEPPPAVLRQDPTSISYGNFWIRQCMTSHTTCAALHDNVPPLPARVVHVVEPGKDIKPCLYASNGEKARYVALSHCWGSSQSLRTTTTNIQAYQQGLEVSDMSQTFRDAINITIGLGLSYLWIDSLCILQDSQEDWVAESAKMSDVYRHAFLTISAFSSADGRGACTISYTQSLVDMPCRVLPDLYVHEDDQAFNFPYRTEGMLHTRAWVLQEEQLSPRTLHCGKDYLIWSCGESVSRHDRPWFHSGEHFSRNMRYDQSWQQQPFRRWRELVRMYSHRNLSFETDKLPAIAGLAAWFCAITPNRQSDYLAGIWKEDLLQSLLWTCGSDAGDLENVPTDRMDSKTAAYTAPSWSWASREGPISFESEDIVRNEGLRCGGPRQYSGSWLTEVVLAEVELHGANPYGQVNSGKLILRGPVLLFPSEVVTQKAPPPPSTVTSGMPSFSLPGAVENTGSGVPVNFFQPASNESRDPQKDWKIHLDSGDYSARDRILLRLDNRACLILEPVEGSLSEKVYRRIGLCTRPVSYRRDDWISSDGWQDDTVTIV